MIKNFYHRIPRRIKIFIIFALIVLAVYFSIYFLTPTAKNTPSEFLEARQEASLIAKNIIFISNRTADNLNRIAALDQGKKYGEALDLVTEEIKQNRQARDEAIKLAGQLELMAKNISAIAPASAGQMALQAVSSETALISRLITYNDYLVQLLEILQQKFSSPGKNTNGKITELLAKINEEARVINELDNSFNQLMGEFDNEK